MKYRKMFHVCFILKQTALSARKQASSSRKKTQLRSYVFVGTKGMFSTKIEPKIFNQAAPKELAASSVRVDGHTGVI